MPLLSPEVDQAIEDRLPVAVAGEIVVGDEVMGDALGVVGAHDRLDVVGAPIARLAALDVDDRAEAALEGTAATGVEARVMADDPPHHFLRQHGDRRRLHAGHVIQVVVDRLRPIGGDVADEVGHPPLALARVKDHAQSLRLFQIRRQFRKHRYAARDMESADHHRHACCPERARKIEGAGKLVRLNPDQPDKSLAVSLYPSRHRLDVDDLVALVIGLELDVDVGTERLLLGASGQKSVDAGEAVRRDGGEPPLDHVAVVVIVRRLDEDDPERPLSHCPPCSAARTAPIRSAPHARTQNRSESAPGPREPDRHTTRFDPAVQGEIRSPRTEFMRPAAIAPRRPPPVRRNAR